MRHPVTPLTTYRFETALGKLLWEVGRSADVAHFQQAVQIWDGMGFKDQVVENHDRYATYKLALALIAAARLNERPPAHEVIVERLLAQQGKDGGWITVYDCKGRTVGLANADTTSLAVLALDALAK